MKRSMNMIVLWACVLAMLCAGCGQSTKTGPLSNDFLKTAEEGDSFLLGKYEQDNNLDNGFEDIEWVILEKGRDFFTAITKYSIECMPYNDSWEPTDWESCDIREWLNQDFYNTAFTQEEKNFIPYTDLENTGNEHFGLSGGNGTKDYVFLLDIETIQYLYEDYTIVTAKITSEYNESMKVTMSTLSEYEPLKAQYTEYAKQKYIASLPPYMNYEELYEDEYGKNSGYWWLRNKGDQDNMVLEITPKGGLFGSNPAVSAQGIRPVITVTGTEY